MYVVKLYRSIYHYIATDVQQLMNPNPEDGNMSISNFFSKVFHLVTGGTNGHAPIYQHFGHSLRPTPRPINQRKRRKRERQTGKR